MLTKLKTRILLEGDINSPGSLTGICAMDVTQLAEAEAITSRRVNITIHCHYRAAGGHLEHLTHLNVHFKVGDRAPELWSCNDKHTESSG